MTHTALRAISSKNHKKKVPYTLYSPGSSPGQGHRGLENAYSPARNVNMRALVEMSWD